MSSYKNHTYSQNLNSRLFLKKTTFIIILDKFDIVGYLSFLINVIHTLKILLNIFFILLLNIKINNYYHIFRRLVYN